MEQNLRGSNLKRFFFWFLYKLIKSCKGKGTHIGWLEISEIVRTIYTLILNIIHEFNSSSIYIRLKLLSHDERFLQMRKKSTSAYKGVTCLLHTYIHMIYKNCNCFANNYCIKLWWHVSMWCTMEHHVPQLTNFLPLNFQFQLSQVNNFSLKFSHLKISNSVFKNQLLLREIINGGFIEYDS